MCVCVGSAGAAADAQLLPPHRDHPLPRVRDHRTPGCSHSQVRNGAPTPNTSFLLLLRSRSCWTRLQVSTGVAVIGRNKQVPV